jgi:hypothetical protein
LGFRQIPGQRLFAQNHFAGLSRRDRNFGVGVIRAGNIDDIHRRILDQASPIGIVRFIAPLVGKLFDLCGVPRGDGLEHGLIFEIEELADRQVGIRVRACHKSVTNQADVELLHERLNVEISGRPLKSFYSFHPCASRTAIIALRIEFQVCCLSITSLENMQPSQQICLKAFVKCPLSSRSQ